MQASAGKVVRLHSFETIYEDLAGGAAKGCTGRGVGGREPPPIAGSNTPTEGSTDSGLFWSILAYSGLFRLILAYSSLFWPIP